MGKGVLLVFDRVKSNTNTRTELQSIIKQPNHNQSQQSKAELHTTGGKTPTKYQNIVGSQSNSSI